MDDQQSIITHRVPTWPELIRLTDDQVRAEYDRLAHGTMPSVNFYRDEMSRRTYEQASEAAHALATASLEEARASRKLAVWNMVIAVIAIVVAVIAIVV